MSQRLQSGLTLIEILVVVAILGILATSVMLYIFPLLSRGSDGRRKSDLHKISNALEEYYSDKNSYPSNSMMTTCGRNNPALNSYLADVPCEPGTKSPYKYVAISNSCAGTTDNPCKGYRLFTLLEWKGDADIKAKGCTNMYAGFTQPACYKEGTNIYNYGVASGIELADP